MTRLKSRIGLPAWGAIGLLVALLALYLVFGGRAGTGSKAFILKAAFRSEAQLVASSPVRIAGVDVGTVTDIRPVGRGSDAATVTMRIDPDGLPVHADATAKIRTRLLLEGNFYVDVSPGSPAAPRMRSGQTIPVVRTSGPVQLDRVLSDLPADTRRDLRTVLQGFGRAYGGDPGRPAPGEDPDTRGQTAGQSVHDALLDIPQALLGTARTTDALVGMRRGDLARAISGQADIAEGLAADDRRLKDLIGSFNTTMGAFADRAPDLRATLRVLPRVLRHGERTFAALDAAFPPTRAFARELRPSLRELPATIAASRPWIAQNRLLLRPSELGGLAKQLRPTVATTARGLSATNDTLKTLDLTDRCLLHNVLPTSEVEVVDPPATSGVPVFKEFFQTFVGVASAAQAFDGNGTYLRALATGGQFSVQTNDFFGQGPLRGNATGEPAGTRPAFPGKLPPYREDVPCHTNPAPDLNGARTGGTP